MKREEVCFFLLFLLIWKDISLLPTYPKVGSKSCSSPWKFIWWVRLILKFWKNILRRWEAERHRRNKDVKWVDFNYKKDKLEWRLRLIENLIKKIKEKSLGLKSKIS